MLYMIFQYGWEPVVIQWILFGLEAILEKYIPGSSIRRPSGCSKPHRYRRCCYWWIYSAVPAKIISQLIVPAKIVILRVAAESVIVAWPLVAKANIFILRFKKCMMMPIKLGTIQKIETRYFFLHFSISWFFVGKVIPRTIRNLLVHTHNHKRGHWWLDRLIPVAFGHHSAVH